MAGVVGCGAAEVEADVLDGGMMDVDVRCGGTTMACVVVGWSQSFYVDQHIGYEPGAYG